MLFAFIKIKSLKLKIFLIFVMCLFCYIFMVFAYVEFWLLSDEKFIIMSTVTLTYVVVHLDLKGSPPKLKYLESLFPTLRNLDVNGLLMEYEDMFPYEGALVNLSSRNSYKKSELKDFLASAVRSGFEIIPLVQTFGHMEHVLKMNEFKHLREIQNFPDSICPSKTQSLNIIRLMLEQVINFHKDISPLRHIHVGCDEVYHINQCKRCKLKKLNTLEIFLNHVRNVADIVSSISPTTTVLIWNDMLNSMKPTDNDDRKLTNIEPVCWDYKTNLVLPHKNLYSFHKIFANIWIASAFKGADGYVATFPLLKSRFLNNFNWMQSISKYKFGGENAYYNFKGIILTGWSRYSHFAPVCELLPVSLPSLLMNLLLIKKFRDGIIKDVDEYYDYEDFFSTFIEPNLRRIFRCKDIIDLDNFNSTQCEFSDKKLYSVLEEYTKFIDNIQKRVNDKTGLYISERYSKLDNINVNNLDTNIILCNDILKNLQVIGQNLTNAMKKYYEADFIKEYVEFKIYKVKKDISNILDVLKNYMKIRTWKGRSYL